MTKYALIWGFLLVAVILVGSMDYADQLLMEAAEKEARPHRVIQHDKAEYWAQRKCPHGWVETYADAGPRLFSCLEEVK